jgi:hypothetical protein
MLALQTPKIVAAGWNDAQPLGEKRIQKSSQAGLI